MVISNRPELTHLEVGDSLKILQINALAGTEMPLHHSTKEAVIVVQEGEAFLNAEGKEYFLEKGSTLLIPANMEHSLKILENFKAVAIMAKDSTIHFNI
ncbi:L-ectoine synthase [Arenibacter antarcticus]|uniref:Cupin domain-containing protein n=1 Tax=Arenibacter antarcticus TaxID=2040469 RepID=A0ABW5VJG8_9FLAO|nr:cupin domain-containing protein [Arenibacter sp. H213]MCM4167267.1 cupin [Arenibacter sp. H213]